MTRPVVAVFGSTRADLFPLQPVLRVLANSDDVDVVLLASGTTANPAFGDPLADLDLVGVTVESIAASQGDDASPTALAHGGLEIAAAMTEALTRLAPAALIVLGDRWEQLYAVPPAIVLSVPLVHLHGGEVTEGAIDDRVRHAISKLADLHCVSTEGAARVLRQLGEPADRIVVTGAPSLDRVAATSPASDEHLGRLLGRPLERPLGLVTYHPPTAGDADVDQGARAVLDAAAAHCGSVLVTAPGLDAGRDLVVTAIASAVQHHDHVVAVDALGADYLPVLAAADVVVGNSSSGVLEAASFGVPVVDVGDRQRGRERGANIVHAEETPEAVDAAVTTALSAHFIETARSAVNVYGDGHAATRILDVVRRAVSSGPALRRKPFTTIPSAGVQT